MEKEPSMQRSRDAMHETWEELDARFIEALKSIQASPAVRTFMALGEYLTTNLPTESTPKKEEMIKQLEDHPDIRLWKSLRESVKVQQSRHGNSELQTILDEYNDELTAKKRAE